MCTKYNFDIKSITWRKLYKYLIEIKSFIKDKYPLIHTCKQLTLVYPICHFPFITFFSAVFSFLPMLRMPRSNLKYFYRKDDILKKKSTNNTLNNLFFNSKYFLLFLASYFNCRKIKLLTKYHTNAHFTPSIGLFQNPKWPTQHT